MMVTAGLISSGCLMSCERRSLDILATSVWIEHIPDYSLAYEDAAETPEHYRVNMYDASTGKLVYRDFVPDGGGPIRGRQGEYLCFLCNFDEGALILSGEEEIGTVHITGPDAGEDAYATFAACQTGLREAFAASGKDVGKAFGDLSYEKQRVIMVEDCFWAGDTTVMVPSLAEGDSVFTVEVNTASVLKQGRVSLSSLQGGSYVAEIQCFVTNLSAGINPVTGELDKERVTEKFYIGHDDDKAFGTFLYFGINGDEQPHFLYALITDTGGGHYLYVYDLGSIDDGELDFSIESQITVPEPSTQEGGGFQPVLGDWGSEHVEVPLG